MWRLYRLDGRLVTVAALLAILAAGSAARGQDDDEEEESVPAKAVGVVRRMAINDAQFDQWVFGNMGVANAGAARNKLDGMLTLQVDDLERACKLTPVQKKKLLLAGRGDVKRFFDQIEELRKKFAGKQNDPNQFQLLWQEIQPLRNTFNSNFFGEASIYAKAIKATLTPEQSARHEELVRDRLTYRYWARVDLAMELLNNEVGFTDDQRRRVLKLLADETRPPRQLGQNDYYAVLYQIGRIPEAKLRPVFEDYQWWFLKRQLDQARGMGLFLKRNGFVADEESTAKAAAHDEPVAEQKALRPVAEKAFRKVP